MMKVSAVPGFDRRLRATSRPEGPSSRNTSTMAMSGACAARAAWAWASEPAASTTNPSSRSSAASIVRVKSESSSSRIRDEACTDATEPTLAVTPGRSQGPDVIRLGSLHPVADAHLRHQAEAAPVRVGAEDRTEAGVQADEQPWIDEPIESDPELRADHDLRAGREEERDRHVHSQRESQIRADRESDRRGNGDGEAPGRPVPGIHLEPGVAADEQRDRAGAHRDGAHRNSQAEAEMRVGGGLEGVDDVEAHAHVG